MGKIKKVTYVIGSFLSFPIECVHVLAEDGKAEKQEDYRQAVKFKKKAVLKRLQKLFGKKNHRASAKKEVRVRHQEKIRMKKK